jgi:hypothetical protein
MLTNGCPGVTRDRPGHGPVAAVERIPIGLITTSRVVSHHDVTAAVNALMAERPDPPAGGDYVTWAIGLCRGVE